MTDWNALGYLAWRQIVNAIHASLKQPARVVLWVVIGLYFCMMFAFRIWSGSRDQVPPVIGEPWASAIFFAFVLALGASIATAAAGKVAGFSSEADARFLSMSHIPERTLMFWLQLRSSAWMLGRFAFLIVLYSVLFRGLGRPLALLLAMSGCVTLAAAIRLPALRARLSIGASPVFTAAVLLIVAGLAGGLVAIAPLADASFAHAGTAIAGLGFGTFVRAALDGQPVPLLAIWGVALAAVAIGYVGGRDVIPELYGASVRTIAMRRRMQSRGILGARPAEERYRGPALETSRRPSSSAFRGAAALIWKDWTTTMRPIAGRLTFVVGLVVAVAVGAIGGWFAHRSGRAAMALSLPISGSLIAMLLVSMFSAVGLGKDIGKPIWWLSADSLRSRLYAYAAGAGWRTAVTFVLAVIAYGAAIGSLAFALAGVPIALVLTLYLRAMGLAIYSIFPNQLDQRGPAAVLRMLVTYGFAIPPIALGIAGGLLGGGLTGGLSAAMVTALAESGLLVEFAARRIGNNGITFAKTEIA